MSDTIHPIIVPKWGLSMTEGILAKWNVEVGASVNAGDVIADIETEKIVNELEIHTSGILRRQIAAEGESIPVGGLLGVIASAAISDEDIDAFVREHVSADGAAPPTAPAKPAGSPDPGDSEVTSAPDETAPTMVSGSEMRVPAELLLVEGTNNDSDVNATHLAQKFASQWRIDLAKVVGTGRRGRISRIDLQRAIAAAGGSVCAAQAVTGIAAVARATPLAQRLAIQHGVDLASIDGTGSRGRVTKYDVIAAVAAVSRHEDSPAPSVVGSGSGESVEIALSNTRRVIARRLSESKQSAPHFRVAIDVRVDELLALRAQLNHDGREQRVSFNDMLVKAVAAALVINPSVNVQYDGETLRQFDDADIAVAVALDEGLITPIVRAANRKSFGEISRETADLIDRAKRGQLHSDEIAGGTFTVSNLGMFGISAFDAIINQPQVAILAVAAAEKRRIYVDDVELVAMVVRATLSCDHRIVDGALGAKFMQHLKQIIEQPGRLLA